MNELLSRTLIKFTFSFFLFVFLFTRSFMGIYIFGFRIGEYAILSAFLFFLMYIYLSFKSNLFISFDKSLSLITYLILINFLIVLFISTDNFIDPYIFKASSYVWTIGYFFLGYILSKNFEVNKKLINSSLLILVYIYFVAIYDLPSELQEFFLRISDKYEPHKGSDVLIMFVSIFYLYIRANNKRVGLETLVVFSSAFLPLLLYKSRGAFIALFIYLIFELYGLRKQLLKKYYLRNIILVVVSLFIFFQSVFLVTESGALKVSIANEKLNQVTQYRAPELKPGEYVNYLFIKDNRFYSTDVNINWRIQIWQDVILDLIKDKKILFGNGYSKKIPAMAALDQEGNSVRSGLDGLNENVHNNFVNILARGGLSHLLLFIIFYLFLIMKFKNKFNNLDIITFSIPILFTSFFDASMENSHYPLIFYFLLGIAFNSDQIFKRKL